MFLISKIVLCLLVAFAFGFGLAWLAWHLTTRRKETDMNAVWQRRFGDLQRERDTTVAKMRHELDDSKQQIPTLESSLRERSDLISQLEGDLIEWREKLPGVQKRLDESEALKDQLTTDNTQLQERFAALEARSTSAANDTTQHAAALAKVQSKLDASVEQVRSAEALATENERTARAIAEELDASLVAQKELARRNLDERDQTIAELTRRLESAARAPAVSTPRPTGTAPEGLHAERPNRTVDDLKKIRGVGPVLEKTLNELGIYFFEQIAALDDDQIDWVTHHINTFPGRIKRDRWVEQSARLAQL